MKGWLYVRFAPLVLIVVTASAVAQGAAPSEIALTDATRVVFAGVTQGRALAATADEYSARTSALERQLKVRTTQTLTEAGYLAELAADVRDWTDDERARVAQAWAPLVTALRELPLPLPARVTLVRMSGRVMGEQVAYTRGDAIYLPVGMVSAGVPTPALTSLLAHELFHVASRHDRRWRDAMYATVGFRALPEVVLPAALAARSMVNPDAPRLDSAIRVAIGDRSDVWVLPVLQSTLERIGDPPPLHFMAVLSLRWLEVGQGAAPPARAQLGDPPRLHDTRDLRGFAEQIGRNTNYIIHAEEILASNYAQMVMGAPAAQSPDVHERMRAVLRAAR